MTLFTHLKLVMAWVGLVLIRFVSCRTCIDLCRVGLVLSRIGSCWCSCIEKDLIKLEHLKDQLWRTDHNDYTSSIK